MGTQRGGGAVRPTISAASALSAAPALWGSVSQNSGRLAVNSANESAQAATGSAAEIARATTGAFALVTDALFSPICGPEPRYLVSISIWKAFRLHRSRSAGWLTVMSRNSSSASRQAACRINGPTARSNRRADNSRRVSARIRARPSTGVVHRSTTSNSPASPRYLPGKPARPEIKSAPQYRVTPSRVPEGGGQAESVQRQGASQTR